MASLLRRRRLLRTTVVAATSLSLLVGGLLWSRSGERYLPGAPTDGLVDTLARHVPADHPALTFTDVTAEAGVVFRHFPATRANLLPEDMGSGVALGDVDGDGLTDIYLVNAAGPLHEREADWPGRDGRCRLFRNRGDGGFEDVTAASGAGLRLLGMGAAFADVDGDGDLDLLVSSFDRLVLLANDGSAHFSDVTAAAGLAGPRGFWTGLAVGDYDRDGALDLYVCGYVRFEEELDRAGSTVKQYGLDIPALINPSTFDPERNLLFHNRGDGTFEEVGAALGVDNPQGRSLAATFADLTGDGWPDLYVANDVSDNALFVNRGDGRFVDETSRALVGDYRGAMGLAVADFDEDLDQDLFITHWIAQENALYVNVTSDLSGEGRATPPIVCVDEADRHGLGQAALDMVGWATGFLDFDCDGRLDLFVVNGSTIPTRDDKTALGPMRSRLFWNAGAERGYFDIGPVCGDFFRRPAVGRGGAFGDLDLDGDPDLVVMRHGDGPALLRNDGEHGRALLVRLRQPAGNRFAIGAKLQLVVDGRPRMAEFGTDGSYLSQHAVGEQLFGLGAAASVERLAVTWPDGAVDELHDVPADSLLTWTRGATPDVRPLPGKAGGPQDLAGKKRFFALLEQASAARVAGDLPSAIADYREALALWPGHEDCLYYLANATAGMRREAEALAIFEELARLHPRSSRAWMQIGHIRLPGGAPALDDLDLARLAFSRSHEINGEESGPVVQLGVVALLRNEAEEADRLLADAAALNPRSIEARYWRGWLAYRRGDREAAAAQLAEARRIATEGAPKEPAPGEGATATGSALLAPSAAGTLPLDAWTTLLERPGDIDAEYGAPAAGALPSPGAEGR